MSVQQSCASCVHLNDEGFCEIQQEYIFEEDIDKGHCFLYKQSYDKD
ncbi:MAG: hypothetical protein II223_02260 [Treponema sp.]|nr:hypothetical protein [Treponema sp.]